MTVFCYRPVTSLAGPVEILNRSDRTVSLFSYRFQLWTRYQHRFYLSFTSWYAQCLSPIKSDSHVRWEEQRKKEKSFRLFFRMNGDCSFLRCTWFKKNGKFFHMELKNHALNLNGNILLLTFHNFQSAYFRSHYFYASFFISFFLQSSTMTFFFILLKRKNSIKQKTPFARSSITSFDNILPATSTIILISSSSQYVFLEYTDPSREWTLLSFQVVCLMTTKRSCVWAMILEQQSNETFFWDEF